ncbi:hypothetical protein PCASD_20435 [Puccinia coronata f. sp. avenae]|uniref:Uncharacterized protein n=1 Tax=Puccinia coronata f. sp. avenae TaxID=200324 RepID=A0A2N5TQR6_9BASI|nr:hypothetical protein PCASD_20435 [Puccinia coronata f. sp. avenae]
MLEASMVRVASNPTLQGYRSCSPSSPNYFGILYNNPVDSYSDKGHGIFNRPQLIMQPSIPTTGAQQPNPPPPPFVKLLCARAPMA